MSTDKVTCDDSDDNGDDDYDDDGDDDYDAILLYLLNEHWTLVIFIFIAIAYKS